MPRIDENYALARIDLPDASTHGWQVRLQRRGVKYAKYFGDGAHGGAENALGVARAWRNELLRQIEASEQARICTRSEIGASKEFAGRWMRCKPIFLANF